MNKRVWGCQEMVKKKEKKRLYIGIKDDIRKIVEDYCEEAGINPGDIPFAMGFLSGAMGEDMVALQQLTFMLQAYFFAGVRYHNKSKKKINYTYMTQAEYEAEAKTRLKPKDILVNQRKNNSPSYVG